MKEANHHVLDDVILELMFGIFTSRPIKEHIIMHWKGRGETILKIALLVLETPFPLWQVKRYVDKSPAILVLGFVCYSLNVLVCLSCGKACHNVIYYYVVLKSLSAHFK